MALEGWPGEGLLIRLWETLEKAGYGYYKPKQIERVEAARTKARVDRMLSISQAKKLSQEILSGEKLYQDGKVVSVKPVLAIEDQSAANGTDGKLIEYKPELPLQEKIFPNIAPVLITKEFSRAANIEMIALMAEEELETIVDQNPEAQPIDEDWFVNWRNRAQDASSEKMQRLWAKVLAGEIANPGNFSIHAMDFLSKMSQAEAQDLKNLAEFIMDGSLYKGDEAAKILNKHGVSFEKLLDLQNLGILSAVDNIGGCNREFIKSPQHTELRALLVGGGKTILIVSQEKNSYQMPIIPLSKWGKELIGLANAKLNEEYLDVVCKSIKAGGYKVSSADLLALNPDGSARVANIKEY